MYSGIKNITSVQSMLEYNLEKLINTNRVYFWKRACLYREQKQDEKWRTSHDSPGGWEM